MITAIRSFQTSGTRSITWAIHLYFLTDKPQLGNLIFTLKIIVITVVLALVFDYLLDL